MNPNKVGKTILFLRKHYNMTQHELAEKLGVTDKAVSRWENGYGTPDISLLSKLSVVLDIDIESILEGNLSNLDLPWKGMLFLEYSDEVGPLDYIFCTRIVELQLSMFMLAGIRKISIYGSGQNIEEVRNVIGTGEEYGCRFEYKTADFSQESIECIVREENKHCCLMIISGAVFIYGKDITKCFRRIVNDNNAITNMFGYNGTDCKIGFYKIGALGNCNEDISFTMDRGVVSFKLRNRADILDASNLLALIERQMGEKVADLYEVAVRRGYLKTE